MERLPHLENVPMRDRKDSGEDPFSDVVDQKGEPWNMGEESGGIWSVKSPFLLAIVITLCGME